MLCKKGVLRNFAKFTGKHLCQRLFFNKVADLWTTASATRMKVCNIQTRKHLFTISNKLTISILFKQDKALKHFRFPKALNRLLDQKQFLFKFQILQRYIRIFFQPVSVPFNLFFVTNFIYLFILKISQKQFEVVLFWFM